MSLRCFYFCSRRCTSKSSSCPSICIQSHFSRHPFIQMFVAKRKSPVKFDHLFFFSSRLDKILHARYLSFFSLFFFFLVCSFNLLRNYNCVRSVNSIELQCYNIENLSVQCGSHWCLCACAVSFQIYRFSCETKCVRACTWCVRVSVTLGSSMSQLNVLWLFSVLLHPASFSNQSVFLC